MLDGGAGVRGFFGETMRRVLISIWIFLFTSIGAVADDGSPPQIAVIGEGVVSAVPDMATVRVGVAREARAAGDAMRAASDAARAVLLRLEVLGIEARDVQTAGIRLDPRYQHTNDGRPPKITGYVASNDLSVRVRDLDALGAVLDGVVSDGANGLGGLTFGVAEERTLMDEARRLAVADAQAKAELLAEASGIGLGPVLSISMGGPVAQPFPAGRSMAMEAAAVPIAAGEMDFRQTVSIVFAIAE